MVSKHRSYIALALMLGLASVPLYFGWRLFWFLTDDAYIAFRYVSNSQLGFGYVWNAPPFRPVEGYTSFLWVVLLDGVWRWFHVEPPESANWISLGFSFGSLVLSALMLMGLRWSAKLKPYRLIFVAFLLVWLLANRTFLAWSSSGLETAMFNFFVHLWVFACVFMPASRRRSLIVLCVSAVLIYVTRPDGALFVLATVAILGLVWHRDRAIPLVWIVVCALPLAAVPLHFIWRYHVYHAWWPNTYYAKHVKMWPESGVRYIVSFALEYALWFWIAVVGWAAGRSVRHMVGGAAGAPTATLVRRLYPSPLFIAGATLAAHVAYYTIAIGGDHFEYRVYSHLIPLVFISLVWALNTLEIGAGAFVLAAALILLSLPVPWTHWSLTHTLTTRRETYYLRSPIAPSWPAGVRWYAKAFDDLQGWLIGHAVCMRHQEHKIFHEFQIETYVPRSEGMKITSDELPVFQGGSIGVPAWVLPNVYIIDQKGLNDYVVARCPVPPDAYRKMAHDRIPPDGYTKSFYPNVRMIGPRNLRIEPRSAPLTQEHIIETETKWWADADQHRLKVSGDYERRPPD